jgi:hypothetical protein
VRVATGEVGGVCTLELLNEGGGVQAPRFEIVRR